MKYDRYTYNLYKHRVAIFYVEVWKMKQTGTRDGGINRLSKGGLQIRGFQTIPVQTQSAEYACRFRSPSRW